MLLRLSGFLPEPIAKIQKSLESDALWGEKLKNIAFNLENPIKISTFAVKNIFEKCQERIKVCGMRFTRPL